jgi:methanogenic corrinoid protein MtbC1
LSEGNVMVAEILETSAAGYAAAANALLQETAPPQDAGTATTWRAHFMQRILELAAAVRVGEPELFARRHAWLRRAFQARGQDETQLRRALTSLRDALMRELPKPMQPSIASPIASALAMLDGELEPGRSVLDPADPAGRLALNYIEACLEGDPDRAIAQVMDAAAGGMPAAEVYLKVLVPAQKEVGALWHVGDIGIAEEHLVSETTRQLMMLLAGTYAPPLAAAGRTVLAASVAGNAHDLGLRVVADLFRLAGWKCLFLGANVPGEEIARAAQAYRADLVVLNATLTTQLRMLGDSIALIRHAAPAAKILVGGLALEEAPALWRQLGADAYASGMDDAISTGAALVGA